MTTITRFTKEQLIEQAKGNLIGLKNYVTVYPERAESEAMNIRLAEIALAALTAEPVAWTDEQELKDVEKDGSGYLFTVNPLTPNADPRRVIKLYTVPPVQETGVYKDMLNIIGLLENNEWAEHCTSTVLGSLLESEITRLVGKEQPATVVPEEITADGIIGMHECGFVEGWNACRAAMLQAVNHTEQHLEMVDHSGDANEKGKDGTLIDEGTKQTGNSPVVPDGYVLVPLKPTKEMLLATENERGADWQYSVDIWDSMCRAALLNGDSK